MGNRISPKDFFRIRQNQKNRGKGKRKHRQVEPIIREQAILTQKRRRRSEERAAAAWNSLDRKLNIAIYIVEEE